LIAVAYSLSNDQEVCHSRTLTTISHGHHLLFQRMANLSGMLPSTRIVWHIFYLLSINGIVKMLFLQKLFPVYQSVMKLNRYAPSFCCSKTVLNAITSTQVFPGLSANGVPSAF